MATKAQIDRLAQRIEALITYAELQARPAARIVIRIVHVDSGRPAGCCLPGGACDAAHVATTY